MSPHSGLEASCHSFKTIGGHIRSIILAINYNEGYMMYCGTLYDEVDAWDMPERDSMEP